MCSAVTTDNCPFVHVTVCLCLLCVWSDLLQAVLKTQEKKEGDFFK